MKMIILNGPPRSGKDTFLKLMKAVFMDDLPTDTFVPFSYKHTICAGVARRYKQRPEYVWELNANTLTKDVPYDMFGGNSIRQCFIYESEEVIKKELGENGVALRTFENLQVEWLVSSHIPLEQCVLVTPDGGFESEMNCAMDFFGIPREDILLVRFYREGCTFEGDSRSYIPNPDLIIDNDGDKISLTKYLSVVKEFIERKPKSETPEVFECKDNLNGGELDTLYQLMINGPLESGDLPSKTGFELLCKKGFAMRDQDTWLGYITYDGIQKFKELKWRGESGVSILDADKTLAIRCMQNPSELEASRGVRVMDTVTGKQAAIQK